MKNSPKKSKGTKSKKKEEQVEDIINTNVEKKAKKTKLKKKEEEVEEKKEIEVMKVIEGEGGQEEDEIYMDENGNVLDENDLSYDSTADPKSVIIFDSELLFMPKINQVEIVFLLDTSRSMKPYQKGVKRFIRKLLFDAKKTISHYENDNLNLLRVGLVGYRDHDAKGSTNYVSKVLCDLTDDLNFFRGVLFSFKSKSGADQCEAVLDGLNEAINKVSWCPDSMKYLYHICDCPPHGSEFKCDDDEDEEEGGDENKEKTTWDYYEDGCPCNLQTVDLMKALRGKYIEYTVVALTNKLKKMIEEFSKIIRVDVMNPKIEKEEGVSGEQEEKKDKDKKKKKK